MVGLLPPDSAFLSDTDCVCVGEQQQLPAAFAFVSVLTGGASIFSGCVGGKEEEDKDGDDDLSSAFSCIFFVNNGAVAAVSCCGDEDGDDDTRILSPTSFWVVGGISASAADEEEGGEEIAADDDDSLATTSASIAVVRSLDRDLDRDRDLDLDLDFDLTGLEDEDDACGLLEPIMFSMISIILDILLLYFPSVSIISPRSRSTVSRENSDPYFAVKFDTADSNSFFGMVTPVSSLRRVCSTNDTAPSIPHITGSSLASFFFGMDFVKTSKPIMPVMFSG